MRFACLTLAACDRRYARHARASTGERRPAGGVPLAPRNRLDDATMTTTPMAIERDTTAGAARIHWRREGRGPAIVFLHGFPLTGATWSPVVSLLRDRHTCVMPDLVGLGASSSTLDEDYASPGQARAIQCALRAADIGRYVLVGNDTGWLGRARAGATRTRASLAPGADEYRDTRSSPALDPAVPGVVASAGIRRRAARVDRRARFPRFAAGLRRLFPRPEPRARRVQGRICRASGAVGSGDCRSDAISTLHEFRAARRVSPAAP